MIRDRYPPSLASEMPGTLPIMPAGSDNRVWLLARTRPEYEVALWCLFYVVVFTAIQLISHGPGDLVNDTLEAVAWGQHPELGYSKHPPFWAWVAFAWFKVFPFTEWSAYLLGSVNAAIGLACTWCVARRFLTADRATGAMLGLMLSATYVCFAQRFNANTVLISLWPAAALAVLRGVERNRIADGILAGLLVAFCLLSKYSSAIYLLALFAAVYVYAGTATVFISRAALACYAVATFAVVPHLIWLGQNSYLPFVYMRATTVRNWPDPLQDSAFFVVSVLGMVAIGTLAYMLAAGTNLLRLPAILLSGFRGRRGAVAFLVFGPGLLTIATALALSSTVRPIYAIPMLFPVPIWIAMAPEIAFNTRALARLRWIVLAVFALCLALAPVLGYIFAHYDVQLSRQPKDEILQALTREWHRLYARPLKIVAGDEDYAIAAPFYSPDHPSYLIGFDRRVLEDFNLPMAHGPKDFDYRLSPWIDADSVRRDGLAIICSEEHWSRVTRCNAEALKWLDEHTTVMVLSSDDKSLFFPGGPVFNFHVYFMAPQ